MGNRSHYKKLFLTLQIPLVLACHVDITDQVVIELPAAGNGAEASLEVAEEIATSSVRNGDLLLQKIPGLTREDLDRIRVQWIEKRSTAGSKTVAISINVEGAPNSESAAIQQAVAWLKQDIQQRVVDRFGLTDTAVSVDVLGRAALSATQNGDSGTAEGLLLERLAIVNRLYGKQHPQYAETLNLLAVVCTAQGRFEEAEAYASESVSNREALYGAEHPDVAESLTTLGGACMMLGEATKCQNYFSRALEIRLAALSPPEHPDIIQSTYNLGYFYQEVKQFDQAEAYYQRALDLTEKANGPKHPSSTTLIFQLARIYQLQQRFEASEKLFLEALAIAEAAPTDTGLDLSFFQTGLARNYADQEQYEQAEALLVAAMNAAEATEGRESLQFAKSETTLGELYVQRGNCAKAVPLYEHALEIYNDAGFTSHPSLEPLRETIRDCP